MKNTKIIDKVFCWLFIVGLIILVIIQEITNGEFLINIILLLIYTEIVSERPSIEINIEDKDDSDMRGDNNG